MTLFKIRFKMACLSMDKKFSIWLMIQTKKATLRWLEMLLKTEFH